MIRKAKEVLSAKSKFKKPAYTNSEMKETLGFIEVVMDNLNFNLLGGNSNPVNDYEGEVSEILCLFE